MIYQFDLTDSPERTDHHLITSHQQAYFSTAC